MITTKIGEKADFYTTSGCRRQELPIITERRVASRLIIRVGSAGSPSLLQQPLVLAAEQRILRVRRCACPLTPHARSLRSELTLGAYARSLRSELTLGAHARSSRSELTLGAHARSSRSELSLLTQMPPNRPPVDSFSEFESLSIKTKNAHPFGMDVLLWLPNRDSNPNKLLQRQSCYRYTIRHRRSARALDTYEAQPTERSISK